MKPHFAHAGLVGSAAGVAARTSFLTQTDRAWMQPDFALLRSPELSGLSVESSQARIAASSKRGLHDRPILTVFVQVTDVTSSLGANETRGSKLS